jgi:eukaryotic-like serine/threonine-protein kinase
MDTDRNALFLVLALQADLIGESEVIDVWSTGSSNPDKSVADRLVERGVLAQADRDFIDREIDRKLTKHQRTVTALLASETMDQTRALLSQIDDPALSSVLNTLSPHERLELVAEIGKGDETRERYTRTKLHARGGMGQVWLARDLDLGRNVALKELRPERLENPIVWQRFLQEAKITGQLEHPGIVPVYELARRSGDNQPYYTMRFVHGSTLTNCVIAYHKKRALGQATALDLQVLLNAFVAVCNAVAYAHSRGVVHRDLKGQNVMLGDFGEVMLLDWGIAKLMGQRQQEAPCDRVRIDAGSSREATVQGMAMGTPAYMPPEQAEGRHDDVDERSDVFSLGAMLYEILIGEPPFLAPTTREDVQEAVPETPAETLGNQPGVHPALKAICVQAMADLPAERYQQASELARDVQRWIADEPVSVYAEPWYARAARWAKRHKTAVIALAVLLVTAVAALSLSTYFISLERNDARRQRQQARTAVDDMYTEVAQRWLEDRLDPLQEQFLQKALAYYEKFTAQDAADPIVRQEKGRAYQRMGDILRKLGRGDEAERAYRQAIAILGALAAEHPGEPAHRFYLASTEKGLGVALAARGQFSEAERLYRKAVGAEEPIATGQPRVVEYQVNLAETYKSLADLLRLTDRATESEKSYRRSIEILEKLAEAAPGNIEARKDLAAAHDFLGILLAQSGRLPEAEASYRRAVSISDKLATEQPLLPRPRQTLSKSLTSLGLFLSQNGDLDEAETSLRRALKVDEWLARDFPLRPEFRRGLARSHVNLGLLFKKTKDRFAESESHYRQAYELYDRLATEAPEELQYRVDLARTAINLGEVLGLTARRTESEAPYRKAIALYEKLAADHPDVPLYREPLGVSYRHLGELLAATDRRDLAIAAYRQSLQIAEDLARKDPTKPDYRKDVAKALTNLGNIIRFTGNKEKAEVYFRRAVETNEKLAADFPTMSEYRFSLANSLNSLAGLKLAGAEQAYGRSIDVLENLAVDYPSVPSYRQLLAISQNNLGEFQAAQGQSAQAESLYRRASQSLERLALEAPAAADNRGYLGYVLANLARLRLTEGKSAEARALFEEAIGHQQKAIAAEPRNPAWRRNLLDHRKGRAQALLAQGDHAAAVQEAEVIAEEAKGRPDALLAAARVLARCVPLSESGAGLSESERKTRANDLAARAVALLQEAVSKDPKAAAGLKTDPDLAALSSRDDFQRIVTSTEPTLRR